VKLDCTADKMHVVFYDSSADQGILVSYHPADCSIHKSDIPYNQEERSLLACRLASESNVTLSRVRGLVSHESALQCKCTPCLAQPIAQGNRSTCLAMSALCSAVRCLVSYISRLEVMLCGIKLIPLHRSVKHC
jgi:hypothetical protein